MLHAIIRSGPATLHFIGRASMENLRELARHLSRMSGGGDPTTLQVALDSTDYTFTRVVRRWMKRTSGTRIRLRVRRIRRQRRRTEPPLATRGRRR
jgi:hypothetical protein